MISTMQIVLAVPSHVMTTPGAMYNTTHIAIPMHCDPTYYDNSYKLRLNTTLYEYSTLFEFMRA